MTTTYRTEAPADDPIIARMARKGRITGSPDQIVGPRRVRQARADAWRAKLYGGEAATVEHLARQHARSRELRLAKMYRLLAVFEAHRDRLERRA
jgi:hypothetical protein